MRSARIDRRFKPSRSRHALTLTSRGAPAPSPRGGGRNRRATGRNVVRQDIGRLIQAGINGAVRTARRERHGRHTECTAACRRRNCGAGRFGHGPRMVRGGRPLFFDGAHGAAGSSSVGSRSPGAGQPLLCSVIVKFEAIPSNNLTACVTRLGVFAHHVQPVYDVGCLALDRPNPLPASASPETPNHF